MADQFPRLCVVGMGQDTHDVKLSVVYDFTAKVYERINVKIEPAILEKLDSCRVAYKAGRVLTGNDKNAIAVILVSMETLHQDNSGKEYHLMSLLFNNVTREYYLFEPLGQAATLSKARRTLIDSLIAQLKEQGYAELAKYKFVPIHTVCMIQKYARQSSILEQLESKIEDYIATTEIDSEQADVLRSTIGEIGIYLSTLGNCDVWNMMFIHSVVANPHMTVKQVATMLTKTFSSISVAKISPSDKEFLQKKVDQMLLEMKVYMAIAQDKCTKSAKGNSPANWCFKMACKTVTDSKVTDRDVKRLAGKVKNHADNIITVMRSGMDNWQSGLVVQKPHPKMDVDEFLEFIL